MSFMVKFRSAEGKPGYHPTDTLEEAVRFVEHLRNQEQVADARVWRMQEVQLEVKTYFKVEVAPSGVDAAPAPRVESEPAAPASSEPVVPAAGDGDVVGAMAPNGARFGRFNRG